MTAGRRLHAALDLLDRQLRDRNGRLCGNVDDIELARSADTGEVYVTALLSGPGHLAYRLGRRRFGRWLRDAAVHSAPPGTDGSGRIPTERIEEGLRRLGRVLDDPPGRRATATASRG